MSTAEMNAGTQHFLAPLCQQWLRQIKEAKKHKWDKFGQYAAEGMKFFDGVHNWMWDEEHRQNRGWLEKGASLPTFQMQVNRIFEAVALYGPALYHQNPDINVRPIDPPFIEPQSLGIDPENPQTQKIYQQLVSRQKSDEMQRDLQSRLSMHYLNWLQQESNKKLHARRSITEAIIKGMGVLTTGMYQPKGSRIQYPLSQHISVDDIIPDPDAEYWEDVQYVAQYCCHPVNLVERAYGLPEGALKGHLQSNKSQGETYGSKRETAKRKNGRTHDLIEYYKIYSKNGFGSELKSTTGDERLSQKFNFDMFGDFCKIVVSEGIPFPLNLPTDIIQQEDPRQIMERVEWEIPYWTCPNGWPFTFLSFYEKPRSIWPISIVKPAVGELRFVNWCMSFLADKTAQACTTYVGQAKEAGLEIQDQIKNNMAPFTVVEISNMTGKKIEDVVSFLDAPSFSADIWNMLAEVLEMIDKRTGLTDLIYGMTSRQLRSATEADIKEENTNIRPDDMANRVEDFLSETAMHEFAACVWACKKEDVEPVLGDLGATIFEQKIQVQDFERVVRDFDYRVSAGTARKPNKQTRLRALNELGQVIVQPLSEFAAQGIIEPWNAYVTQVAEALDIDAGEFLIPEPKEEDEGPDPEQQKTQLEVQAKQLELQLKKAEFQLKQQQAENDAALKRQQAESELDRKDEEHEMELQQDVEEHRQEMGQDAAKHSQEMEQTRRETSQEMMKRKAELDYLGEEQRLKLEALKKQQQAQTEAKRAQARAAKEPDSSQ